MFGMFSKYLISQQAETTRKYSARFKNIRAPPPRFWHKGKSLVLCTKAGNINVKLILFIASLWFHLSLIRSIGSKYPLLKEIWT